MTQALVAFLTVADLAAAPIRRDLVADFREAPHRPPSSPPAGKMTIYAFWTAESWLKIGMAGARSQARRSNQPLGTRLTRCRPSSFPARCTFKDSGRLVALHALAYSKE